MSLLNPNQQPHLYQPLPTPRALLTSLLNSLSTSSPQPTSTTDASPNSKSKSTITSLPTSTNTPPNPLKTLSASQKSLLATLHVLFPPPTLLQALDLLDRGLVMRVRISSSSQQQGVVDSSISLPDVGADVGKDEEQEISRAQDVTHAQGGDIFYRVRSAQFQARSRYHAPAAGHADLPSGGLVYTVRLKAWNCDCAAFAFAAFPPVYPPLESEDYEQNGAWEGGDVGGLSFNGREGGEDGIPVCKHLLACLLAERWEGVLGTYLREWRAGREEGAGIAGS